MNKLLSFLLVLTLAACSGDGSSDVYPNTTPTLADIAGIYEESNSSSEDGLDPIYTMYSRNGDLFVYFHRASEVDGDPGCYNRYSTFAEMRDLGAGIFVIDNSSGLAALTTRFQMSLLSENELEMILLNRTGTLEFDFSDSETLGDFEVTYNDNGTVDAELTIDGTIMEFEATYSNVEMQWSITPLNEAATDHVGFIEDESFIILGLAPSSVINRYAGSESDFTPICESDEVTQ